MQLNLLAILRQISEIIAGTDDYDVVLAKIVKVLASNLNVEVCSIYAYEEETARLKLSATFGLNQEAVGEVFMRPGEGLTGLSFQQRKILNLVNPDQHPKFKFFSNTGEERYRTFLSVPLTAGGRCVGILIFQSVKEERFPHAVVDMVKTLSTQLANLILNAKMLKVLVLDKEKQVVRESDIDEPSLSDQVMLRGIAANDGLAIGQALVFQSNKSFAKIVHSTHDNVDEEIELFEKAVTLTKKQTVELENKALTLISEIDASIFNAHLLILEDKDFMNEIRNEITEKGHAIEFSVKLVYTKYHQLFAKLADPVFREKEMDIKDVLLRLVETVRTLRTGRIHHQEQNIVGDNQILVAEELLPSDLVRMPIGSVVGIVCEKGGVTAHVAILAKALDIPALMGVSGVVSHLKGEDELILDCHAELMYIRPNEDVKVHFKQMMEAGVQLESEPDALPAVTRDSVEITLRANISLICETALLAKFGAKGVGLYRTEFLFMIRDSLPNEDAQYHVFSKILKEANGELVTIRLLDSGGDKPLPYIDFPHEDNPALGNRGIRLLLSREGIFKTQLKAILRAGVHGKLRILFPMVTTLQEIFYIRQILSEVETELHANSVTHTENYEMGIMLEVPSVIFGLDTMIREVDYISIGSNDLLQYCFAVDRGNEQVSRIHQPLQPVFLSILKQIGEKMAGYPDKGFSICGEMAGNVLCIPFLLGAGIKEFSMAPRQIPSAKKVIRSFALDECRKLIDEATQMTNPESVSYLIKEKFADKGLNDII